MALTNDFATLVNIFTVAPENQRTLIGLLEDSTETLMKTLDGWVATNILAGKDGKRVIVHSQWRNAEAIAAMRERLQGSDYLKRIAAIASFESVMCDVAYGHRA